MPSLSVPAENDDYFAQAGSSSRESDISSVPEGDDEAELVNFGSVSEAFSELQEEFMGKFMEQSTVFNTTDDNLKLQQCFYEYITSILEPDHDPSACPVKFDGVSCWPETSPGKMRAIPCFSDFNGVSYDPSENNATLYCHPNGTWSTRAFYNFCLNAVTNTSENTDSTVWAKSTIFYFGNSLSLVAVTLAVWIFISFKDLRCLRNTIHTNLLFTYLHPMFWILYATIQTFVGEGIGCAFFVALNYFFLTNIMWMFVEGLYLYMLVVKTFEVESIKLRVYTLIGWGVPVPIIITWVIAKTQITLTHHAGEVEVAGMEELDIEGLWSNVCPLMAVSHVDWIQKVAVLFLLSTNIIFLLRIMWVLITKLRSANNVETQRYWKATKALLVLIPLLGLTYMLLIILPKELEHVQAILLSTQGFWVAVFFCFLNSEVQNSIRHHIERWKAERGMIDPRGASVRLSRDGSPRPRFGCSRKGGRLFGGKRESLCTDSTTMTTVVINGCNTNSSAAAPPAISPQPSRRISKASSLIPLADQDARISVTDSTI
ncbi:diuretic hormone receptor-like [Macrobrachium rosenbergii]|uniref:diuretic hormone receptor-like n=1 Tax=Macrobrachium rosenbergii TaxID=79674 RepID=UPI0034D3AF88